MKNSEDFIILEINKTHSHFEHWKSLEENGGQIRNTSCMTGN